MFIGGYIVNIKTKLIFKLLLLLIFLPFTIVPSLALDNTSFDQTLSMLNVVTSAMGVLVGLIAFVFVLFAFFGISSYQSVKRFEKEYEKKLINVETQLQSAKNKCEEAEAQLRDTINKLKDYARNRLNELDEEIKDYTYILTEEIPPKEILRKFSEYETKLETFEALGMPLEPNDLLKRGINLYFKKRYQDALKVFDKLLEIEPDNFEALANKGTTLATLKKYKEAIKACDMALAINNNCSRALNTKGYILGIMGNHKGAIEAFDKALEIEQNDVVALTNKGYALAVFGKFEEARVLLDKALTIDPKDASTLYAYACIYSLMNEKKEAIENLRRSIELNPSFKERAKDEEDFMQFTDLWNDIDFKRIIE